MNQSIQKLIKTRQPTAYDTHKHRVECDFCNERCIMDYGTNGLRYWRCDHHGDVKVKYLIGDPPDIWYSLIFACEKKNRYFHVNFFYNNSYMTEMFRIDEVIKVGSPASYGKPIFSLQFHPKDITPDNVIDKMSLWLPFS